MNIEIKLTVYFEEPFWVGIFERKANGNLEVSRIVFGSEPKDYEVYDFVSKNINKLRFSMSIEDCEAVVRKINPKGMQKVISNQFIKTGVATKAQEALRLQHEQNKLERKSSNSFKNQEEKQRKFELKQQKKKEKHRGR